MQAGSSGRCDPNQDWGNLQADEKVVVGYYPNWSAYGRHYYLYNFADHESPGVPSKILPHAYYSHIQYAFINVSPDGRCVSSDPSIDLSLAECGCVDNPSHFREPCDCDWVKTFGGHQGLFADMAALKQTNPNIKMLMSIGGWTYSQNFSDIAQTQESRRRFISSCVDFMNTHGFDGIDIDWEYPGGGGRDALTCDQGIDPCSVEDKTNPDHWTPAGDGVTYSHMRDGICRSCRPEDGENYVSLLQEFREAMPQGYTLSVAVGASPARIADMNIRDMSCYLDWMGIMTYDFHGSWEQHTGFQSPLRRGEDRGEAEGLSIEEAAQNFLAAGLPASKLVTGAAFYGRGWGSVQQAEAGGAAQGLPVQAPNAQTGNVTNSNNVIIGRWEAGIWDYRGISEQYLDPLDPTRAIKPGYIRGWDEIAQTPYLYSEQDGIWFGYEDAQSTRIKAQYVRDQGYRGVIIWDTSLDDCDNTLARAVNEGLSRQVSQPPTAGCRAR